MVGVKHHTTYFSPGGFTFERVGRNFLEMSFLLVPLRATVVLVNYTVQLNLAHITLKILTLHHANTSVYTGV